MELRSGHVTVTHLRDWREKRLLMRKELAVKSKVAVSTIAKIELGTTTGVRLSTVAQLAKALGVTREQLIEGPKESIGA